PCVLGETVYTLHGGILRSLHLADLSESSAPVTGEAAAGARSRGPCGRRGSTLVMAVTLDGRDAVLGLEPGADSAGSSASIRWRIELPERLGATAVEASDPDALPLAGALPRRVPLLLGASRDAPGSLIMLDVEAGRVSWRSANLPWLAGAHITSADSSNLHTAPALVHLAVSL